MPLQVIPSVEYCQVPLPLLAVIAMPLPGPSGSAVVRPARMVDTRVPFDMVSSLVPVRL